MKPINYFFKRITITIEYFYKGMMTDIKNFFKALFSVDTYINILNIFSYSVKSTYSKPKHHVLFALFLLFISIYNRLEWYWISLSFLLFLYTYFRKIWLSGDPLKFYEERFFPEKFRKL